MWVKYIYTHADIHSIYTIILPFLQAIFATFPHGVNSDFRACIDALFPASFPRTAPPRTLAATVLFRIPGIRRLCLSTGEQSSY